MITIGLFGTAIGVLVSSGVFKDTALIVIIGFSFLIMVSPFVFLPAIPELLTSAEKALGYQSTIISDMSSGVFNVGL